jgi:hypothetical protein
VDLHVLLQIRAAGKLFTAVLAREGFLTSVYALVADEVGDLQSCQRVFTYLGEGPEAVRELAIVGLLSVVHSRMFLQGRILGEGLVTYGTIIVKSELALKRVPALARNVARQMDGLKECFEKI